MDLLSTDYHQQSQQNKHHHPLSHHKQQPQQQKQQQQQQQHDSNNITVYCDIRQSLSLTTDLLCSNCCCLHRSSRRQKINSHQHWRLNTTRILFNLLKSRFSSMAQQALRVILFLLIIHANIFNVFGAQQWSSVNPTERRPLASVEKELIRTLMVKYSKFGVIGRPVNDSRVRLTVEFGLALIQILDLDENKQTFRTNVWERWRWKDALLTWDPEKYHNIKQIRVFRDQVWVPDIKLFNFADERLSEHREARLVVHFDGTVMWIPQCLYKSTCYVDITYFPFDSQQCSLKFGSGTYDETQLDITWWHELGIPEPFIDFKNYVKSNEWQTDGENEALVNVTEKIKQIKSVILTRNQTYTNTNGLNQTKLYHVLEYKVRLHRNSSFYIFILVLPCILLSALTLIVFWLPPESPAKLMLGMNIFIAFFVLMLLLAESTPTAVESFPLIGGFFCLNMSMIAMSTFLVTFVINLYLRGDRLGRMPRFIRRFIIDGLGRLLFVRQYTPLPDSKAIMKEGTVTSSTSAGPVSRKVHVPQLQSDNKFIVSENLDGDMESASFTRRRDWTDHSDGSGGGGIIGSSSQAPSYHHHQHHHQQQQQPHHHYSSSSQTPPGPQSGLPPHRLMTYAASGIYSTTSPSNVLSAPLTSTTPISPLGGAGGAAASTSSTTITPKSAALPSSTLALPSNMLDVKDSPLLLLTGSMLERDVREIKRYVRQYIDRQKEADNKNLISMEWRALASVLDRFFFATYVLIIFIAVLIVYVSQIAVEK